MLIATLQDRKLKKTTTTKNIFRTRMLHLTNKRIQIYALIQIAPERLLLFSVSTDKQAI